MKANNIKFSPVNIEERKKLNFQSGDTVRVVSKIPEEKGPAAKGGAGKFRLQAFEGTEPGATFTVRKIASGVGVERIFPLYSPMIDKIEIVRKSRARRSKLYYIREKAVKDVRRKMRSITSSEEEKTPEEAKAE